MSLFAELKRRNVFRVALFYIVAAWVVIQVAETVLPMFDVPDSALRAIVIMLALGFPLALVFSWVFEITPDGIQRESEVDVPEGVKQRTANKLNWATLIAAVLAIGLLIADRMLPETATTNVSADSRLADRAQPDAVNDTTEAVTIAVLPFADLSPERNQEYFSDGLAEEILNLLASVRDLSVASRTSAFSFKGSGLPIPEIADRLGVAFILEGSVRKSGDRIRVTAQLIDARSDRHLWSENYDRTLADVFAVQDEIAGAIGKSLQVALLGRDGQTISTTEIAPDLYEKFLQSRFLLRQRNLPAIARATALLEQVVEGEPDFAAALAQLAEAHLLSGGAVETADQLRSHLDRILDLVDRALDIESELAGAYAVRGNVAMTRGQYVDALDDYRRAIELDPDDPRPHHWLAMLYSDSGHLEQAEQSISTSLRLDPENANAQGAFADLLAVRSEWQEAIEVSRRVVDLGNPVGHAQIAGYLLAMDHKQYFESAKSQFQLALDKGTPPDLVPLRMLDVVSGDETAVELMLDDARSNRLWLYVSTSALLILDQHEALLTLLEWDGFVQYSRLSALVWSPSHATIRRDPRFVAYLKRWGVIDLWREIGPPPDCVAEGDRFRCGLMDGQSDRRDCDN